MADKKISALTAASTPLAGTEVLPIVQSGSTVKVSVDNLTAGKAVSTAALTSTTTATFSPTISAVQTASTNGICSIKATSNSSFVELVAGGSTWATNYMGANEGGLMMQSATPGAYGIRLNIYGSTNPTFRFSYGATDVLSIDASGNTKVGIGNIVPQTAAKGVNFTANTPATGMTSQLLNWYEEGTWTPVLDSAVAGSGRATTVNSAKYTRIGNMVIVQCYIKMDTLGTGGSGAWSVKGLPFTSAGSNAYGVAHIGYAATLNAAVGNLGGYISPSTTVITITGSTGASTLPYGDLDFATYVKANTEIIVSATYYV